MRCILRKIIILEYENGEKKQIKSHGAKNEEILKYYMNYNINAKNKIDKLTIVSKETSKEYELI